MVDRTLVKADIGGTGEQEARVGGRVRTKHKVREREVKVASLSSQMRKFRVLHTNTIANLTDPIVAP